MTLSIHRIDCWLDESDSGATTAEIPVKVSKITLSATGQGKGTYTDPSTGVFEVKLKVRDNGRASGTITPKGLCRGKVTFTAKRN